MSVTDHLFFRSRLIGYKVKYDKDGDAVRYYSNVAVSAASFYMTENNIRGVLPTLFSISSPALMAAIDSVAHKMDCPVEQQMSMIEFLAHFRDRVKDRYDAEYVAPTRRALQTIHDGLNSLLNVSSKCPHCRRPAPESSLIRHNCCGQKFCKGCSDNMLTHVAGKRYLLNCDCGEMRNIDV